MQRYVEMVPVLAAMSAGMLCMQMLPGSAYVAQAAVKPNIVLIMTDDQTLESMRVMPLVQSELAAKGVTFANHYASYPLCCPSRATLLTGQYSHNHGVHSNKGDFGGYGAFDNQENTLPVWLQDAGYQTIHLGKYLNGYGKDNPTEIPPGWDDFQALVDETGLYGYTINDNGALVFYGSEPQDYQTDVLRDRAIAALDARAGSTTPFFLHLTTKAPHAEGGDAEGPRAAPRHEGLFADEPLPTPPNFNEADVSDKPQNIRDRLPMNQATIDETTRRYRDRAEALQAVDELVRDVVARLDLNGQLADTVIFFTSDNGFFHGEHRIDKGKIRLYEEGARVPLVIRGKAFKGGVTRTALTWNGDVTTTIVQLAGATAGRLQDGQSLKKLVGNPAAFDDRVILLENDDPITGDPYVDGIRTEQYKYVEWTRPNRDQEFELYDLLADPYELDSRHDDPAFASVRASLAAKLEVLNACAGTGCRQTFP